MAYAPDNDPLAKEFAYYIKHQDELVRMYNGKFVAIRDEKVVGVFEDLATAIHETAKQFELGTFLVQQVEPGTDAYTRTYHSRVTFATKR